MKSNVSVENKEEAETPESSVDATQNSEDGDVQEDQEDTIEENESDADDSPMDDDIGFQNNEDEEDEANENEEEKEATVIQPGTRTDENEDFDAMSESGHETFLTDYAARIKVLIGLACQCDNIMTDAITSELVYPQDILSDVLDAVSKVKDLSTKIEKDCQDFLEKINQEKLEIGLPQLDDDFSSLSDPADRPSSLSDLQTQKIIELGPYQPKLKTYPNNREISAGKQCRFVFGWFKEYPHLEYSIKGDTASCFVCSLFPAGPGREKAADAWIKGLRSWDRMKSVGKDKQGKLAKHFSSESHKAALSDLAQYADSMRQVDVLLNRQLLAARIQEEEDNIRNQEIIKILLDIARTLARQQIAFRGNQEDTNGNFIQIAHLIARHNQHLRY